MKLLHELIQDTAAAFPAKTAAEDVWGSMSYGELEARSASIASVLAALGIHPGDAAAVYVPYAKEIILGAVSVFRAGGVFVPFDDAYPEERMNYMLNDCEAKAVLTVRELWEKKKLDFPEDRVIFLDGQAQGRGQGFSSPLLTASSPAMLLYTSGTTGKPKGVPHSHEFLVHLADWMNIHEGAEMNADTRSGVMSSFAFVGTQMFLLGPLAKGGAVCVAPEAARRDLASLYQFLRQARVTHIFRPSGLAAFLAEDYDISGVLIFAAGEKLRAFHPHCPGNRLINSYGSTETSGVLSKTIFGDELLITVGTPYINTKTLLVDEALRPVAEEETGELLISNSFMAKEYFKLPASSAEKWVEINGGLWFRTGDRARRTADGGYELLGRTDNMIKLRGFRIETGEVEAQIAKAAAKTGDSAGSFVVVKKTVGGADHLCCYYEGKEELDKSAILKEIKKYLAPYMVPDIWVRLDALPRNANGKVLRSELPQPRRARNGGSALDSELIYRIVCTAAEALEINEPVSPDDSFTALGGTSLTAMVFTSRLRDQGIKIRSVQALQLNSFREIANAAEVVWEQLWTPKEYETVRNSFAQRGEHIQKVLPVSSWQDEMLFDQIIHPDWAGFKDAVVLQLDSVVSQADLREALDILAAENEELRSAIVFHGVTVIQQVITDRKIPLEIIEVKTFGSRETAELRNRILYTPMDPQYSSLMKVIAARTEKETFLYVLTHRIAFGRAKRRSYLARIMGILENKYPDDVSIRGWREILEEPLFAEQPEKQPAEPKEKLAAALKKAPPEICVYSENKGPKLVFVHTGNTGSEAYYRLAGRIKDQVSFSVIEPFNLYHPDQAQYGIQRIAAKYIEILKRHQPQGPYLLGGWCYGGVVAHEMACQLTAAGEEVRHLFMLDSHALGEKRLVKLFSGMSAQISQEYFETCPLFAELRENGLLEAVVTNALHVSEDLRVFIPSFYPGDTTYFKPRQIPAGIPEESRKYWETLMEYSAGNYENYCSAEKLRIVATPHEHDLMMDDASLDIIVPEILKAIQ